MWPPKDHLDNVQFRNKAAMVQTDQSQRPSSALSLSISTSCAFWATLTGCPSVSWNCCCDNFISPALTLQAVIHSFQRVPQFGYKILWSIGRLFARDIQRDKTVSFYPSAALHCFVCLYPVVSFHNKGHRCTHLPSAYQFERDHRGLWCASTQAFTRVYPYRWPKNGRNVPYDSRSLTVTATWT